MRNSLLLGGLVALVRPTLAAVNCTGDFTLSNASIVRDVRENCRVVGGRISIPGNYTGDLNLDGVEAVRGGIAYHDCPSGEAEGRECSQILSEPRPFTLSSDTLREVRDLSLWAPNGLSKVVLPNLRVVNGTLSVRQALHLVELDLSGLKYLSGFMLEAPRLETFKLDGLEGFTPPTDSNRNLTVSLIDIGTVSSVDGIYSNNLDPLELDEWNNPIYLSPGSNLSHITLGWTRIPKLVISPDWLEPLDVTGSDLWEPLNVTLGGPNTTSMEIDFLLLGSTSRFERAPTLESLTVKNFEMSHAMEHNLTLPFDDASDIHIHFYFDPYWPRYLTLPPQAANWSNPNIWIQGYEALQLTSDTDSEGRQTWYWPKTMRSLFLGGNITNDFFTSFMEQNVVVTEEFALQSHWPGFDCKILEDYSKRTVGMVSEIDCHMVGHSGAMSLMASKPLQAMLASALVFWLML